MKIIGTIVKAVIVAYLVIFAVINMQNVQLTLFFGMAPFDMPMFLFTILVIFIGFIAGVLMMTGEKITASSRMKQLKKQLAEAWQEIERLKNIPLAENMPETSALSAKETNSNEGGDANAAIKDALRQE